MIWNRNLPPDVRSLCLVVALLGLTAPRIGVAQQALPDRKPGRAQYCSRETW